MELQRYTRLNLNLSPSRQKSKGAVQDAITFLTDSHNKVRLLFKAIERMKSQSDQTDRLTLVEKVCTDLLVHMAVEESVFYPAIHDFVDDPDMLDEHVTEHVHVRELIMQLAKVGISDSLLEEHIGHLRGYIEHHASDEEADLFPHVREADIDLDALGQELVDSCELMRLHYAKSIKIGRPKQTS